MSGWDVQMQSQQMANQARLGWGQIEASARNNSAQMLAQGGQQIGGMIQQQRQFDAHQQMQAAQMQQQAQQFIMQNEIERQDAASQLALRQQQMQESQLKIEAMKQLDTARLSQAQVEAAELSNRAARLQIQEAERKASTAEEDRGQEAITRFINAAGLEGLAAGGFRPEVSGRSVTLTKFKNEEEQSQWIDNYRKMRQRSSTPLNESTERKRLQNEATAAYKLYRDADDSGAPPDVVEAYKQDADLALSRYREAAGNPEPTAQTQPAKLSMADQLQVDTITSILSKPFDQSSTTKFPTYKKEDAEPIARWINANRETLRQMFAAGQDPSRRREVTDQDAITYFMSVLQNPDDERHAKVMQALRQKGVIK